MVTDFEEGRILGELQDLEEEIALCRGAIERYAPVLAKIAQRTLKRLEDLKYHQEMRLKIHRQKVKDSGIKY